MDEHPHLLAKATAVLIALIVGSIHLVTFWGTFAMVVDLLWMPPLIGMAWHLARDGAQKPQTADAQRS